MTVLVGIALSNLDNIALAIVAIATALAVVAKIVWKIHTAMNVIDWIYHEVVPNAGSSLRDAIDRIETRIDANDAFYQSEIGQIKASLDKLNEDQA